jgi:hypothetical protein
MVDAARMAARFRRQRLQQRARWQMLAETFGHKWLDMDLPFPCEIHAYVPRVSVLPKAMRVLAIFTEPKKAMIDNEWVRANHRLFNLIATYDRTLADLPNVKIIDFGGAHCNFRPSIKDFTVSYILSTGCNLPDFEGYQVRRDIAMNFGFPFVRGRMFLSSRTCVMESSKIDLIIESSKNKNYIATLLGDSKADVFVSMFNIAIENNVDEYYFTEKLTDCFRTYTVPIYWGTKRVLDLFDPNGIIYIEDPSNLQNVVSSLTPDDYWKRIDAMARNFALAENYVDPAGRLKSLILASTSWSF